MGEEGKAVGEKIPEVVFEIEKETSTSLIICEPFYCICCDKEVGGE